MQQSHSLETGWNIFLSNIKKNLYENIIFIVIHYWNFRESNLRLTAVVKISAWKSLMEADCRTTDIRIAPIRVWHSPMAAERHTVMPYRRRRLSPAVIGTRDCLGHVSGSGFWKCTEFLISLTANSSDIVILSLEFCRYAIVTGLVFF